MLRSQGNKLSEINETGPTSSTSIHDSYFVNRKYKRQVCLLLAKCDFLSENPNTEPYYSEDIRGRVSLYPVSTGVQCPALWAGGNTRGYQSIHDQQDNNQRHSKPVTVLVEDQSNFIFLSITEKGTKFV